MKVYFATTNEGKIDSAKKYLEPLGIKVIPVPLEIDEPDVENLKLIAGEKAKSAFAKLQKPVIAVDSGFYLHACPNYPGYRVGRELKQKGLQHFLDLVNGKDRGCEFRDCLAFMAPGMNKPLFFLSNHLGHMAEAPRKGPGKGKWSPLWDVFISDSKLNPHQKTLSELSDQERSVLGYERAKAGNHYAVGFGKWLVKWVKKNRFERARATAQKVLLKKRNAGKKIRPKNGRITRRQNK